MRRVRLIVLVVMVVATLVSGTIAATASRSGSRLSAAGPELVQDAIYSDALHGTLHFVVWLPRGYATHPDRRYPVLYVLHGLPGGEYSYRSLRFLVPALKRLDAQALVVFPQGARPGDRDDEYLDLGPGRDWATALAHEVTTAVDSRYRTLATRDGRGIIGISAGGYGATILGLHNLDRYRVIESWSGYFHPTTPDGSAPMSLSPKLEAWADAHRLVPRLAPKLRRKPTLVAFYTGTRDPYPAFTAENRRLDDELRAAGVPHRFAVYRGGHDTTLWRAHASAWLRLALRTLASPR